MPETPEFYHAFIFANFSRFYPHARSTFIQVYKYKYLLIVLASISLFPRFLFFLFPSFFFPFFSFFLEFRHKLKRHLACC